MSKEVPIKVEGILGDMIEWNGKYLDVVIHAIERYEDEECARKTIRKFLSTNTSQNFRSTNPASRVVWMQTLLETFLAGHSTVGGSLNKKPWSIALESGEIICAWMTFTNLHWSTAHTNIQFDLERAKQKIRNCLGGLNFLASFEAAVINNEYMETGGTRGKVVSFHCHAIVWATNMSQLKRRREKVVGRFKPLFGARSSIRIDRLKKEADLHRTLRYQGKMPVLGYRTIPSKRGGKNFAPAKLSGRTHYRLFEAFKHVGLFDLWLGGGEGAKILSEAKQKLDLHYYNQWRRGRTKGKHLFPVVTEKKPIVRNF